MRILGILTRPTVLISIIVILVFVALVATVALVISAKPSEPHFLPCYVTGTFGSCNPYHIAGNITLTGSIVLNGSQLFQYTGPSSSIQIPDWFWQFVAGVGVLVVFGALVSIWNFLMGKREYRELVEKLDKVADNINLLASEIRKDRESREEKSKS